MQSVTEILGWKAHGIKEGDGQGGWTVRPAEYQILHHPDGLWTPPFGLAQMDNGEIILMGSHRGEDRKERTVFTFSADYGDTWSDFEMIPDSTAQRPTLLASLGGGGLRFVSDQRYWSSDYGRTWCETMPRDDVKGYEGNPLVEYDETGRAVRMAEIGYPGLPEAGWPQGAFTAIFRWSDDGGRTFRDSVSPTAWRYTETVAGVTYERGASEGSVVRAHNGWLVAALRTDIPARYLAPYLDTEGHGEGVYYDDSLEGTGVSISQDDGQTWSPVQVLFEAGRHHAHLLAMPNGDLVMTLTVRVDVRDGTLASYRRGCDALISTDHGLTWNLDRRIILDEYEFFDGNKWFNGECGHLCSLLLDDGRILTAHANYLTKGMSLIRWQP